MSDTAAPSSVTTESSDAAAARAVRRALQQWPLVLVCGLIGAVAAFGTSASRTKQYEASTTVQLTEVDLASVFTGQSLQQQGQDAQAKAATNAKLVAMPRVREAASKALGGELTPGEIGDAVTVAPTAGTTLVEIVARSPDPEMAAKIADAVRESFIVVRREAAVSQFDEASDRVTDQLARIPASRRNSAAGQLLRDRLQEIDTLRAVSNGGVETVQDARVPTSAAGPRPKRDAVLGLLAGLVVGAGIALLRARLDDRVRSTDELSELWEIPVVGLVPETDGLRQGGPVLPDGPALEALSLARTNLRYLLVGGELRTLTVTSALEGEGKSTITWNLGVAAALADSRVLVIEADLRRPMITSRLGVSGKNGLSEVLAGIADLDDAITPVDVSDEARGVAVTVDVLPAGLAPPSPIALLEGHRMTEVLATVRDRYDIVLIDTPPATIVADALAFMEHVDGVLIVSRLGKLRRGALMRLRDLLRGIDAPVIGQIVNSGGNARVYGYTAYTQVKAPVLASSAGERS